MASDIQLKVVTTADTAGLKEATADLREMDAAADKAAAASARQSVAVVQQTTATASAAAKGHAVLADSTQRVNTTTANTGQTMLTFGRILQDGVAAGLPGMVNNFEGLAMALGLGGGVAGAVTILAVGLQTLLPLLAGGEDKAQKMAEANEGAASKARTAAIETGKQAAQMDAAALASDAFAESLERITRAYDEQARAASAVRQAREHEARLRQVEGDAQAELDMAETEDAASRGAISPEEAEARRAQIARDSARRKFETEQEIKKAVEADQMAKANARRQQAEALKGRSAFAAEKAPQLMTEGERTAAEAELKRAEADSENERAKLAQDEQTVEDFSNVFSTVSADDAIYARKQIERRKARVAEAAARARELRAALERDKAAQTQDIKSREDAEKQARDLAEKAAEAETEAATLSGGVKLSEGARAREGEAFKTRDRAAELRAETARRQREAAAEAARQQRGEEARRRDAAEQETRGEIGRGARDLAGEARSAGFNTRGAAQLEAAGKAVAQGDEKAAAALETLLAALAGRMQRDNARNERRDRLIEELRADLAALKDGH